MLEQERRGAVMFSRAKDNAELANDFAMMLQTLLDRYPNEPDVIAQIKLSRDLAEVIVGMLMKKQS